MSGKLWLPQWEHVLLGGPDGDPYTNETNIKILWHRWEGTTWAGAESAFRAYPPHVGYRLEDRKCRQYVPLDEHAYALAGSRNEGEFVIQIEVSGFSRDSRNMTEREKANIAHDVLEPILFFFPDVPDTHPPFYDDRDGFTLASPNSRIRFKFDDWRIYSGHVGHQHAPAPDEHWDPGRLDLDTIIRMARENGHIVSESLQEVEMKQCLFKVDNDRDIWITDFITKRHVKSDAELDDIVYLNKAFDGKLLFTPEAGAAVAGERYAMVRRLGDRNLIDSIPTVPN